MTAVLSNAVRYLDPADSPLAQVLDAARQRAPLGSPRLALDQRPAARNGQAHLASGAQMAHTAARVTGGAGPDADRLLADTAALARRCYLDPGRDLGIGARHLPEPSLQKPACREPACREPAAGNQPAGNQPAGNQPAGNQPPGLRPTAEPASRPPADREPASRPATPRPGCGTPASRRCPGTGGAATRPGSGWSTS